ncbi:hypothetical protein EJB05_01489 [Eragrostis curvula]|uniref:Uncharacterized protein n=1 Tax=Eragrostis curvula TaxID=38414 RepID=A0A5J9WN48_9POAL|nr:hypothetical protein EJB05_01489 [Eragrostis curvula]
MSSRGNNRKNKSVPKVVTKRGRKKKKTEQSESEPDDPNDESYEPSEHEFGQGSSAVHGGGHDDEMGDASDEDHEINVTLFCGQKKAWTSTSYIQARRVNAYTLENDSPSPHFHTKVQHDAFFGHLLNKNVYEHRWIDWEFIDKYATINCLINKFRHIRLFEFVKHKCDWNDNIIRQFYATCEIDWKNEKIEWMTGTGRYNATIQEFAIANKLDYAHIWGSHDVWNENKLMETIWYEYYEAAIHGHPVKYGTVTGLKLVPAVANKIVRHTIFPKSGNPDAVRDHHWNFIHHILGGRTIDVLRFILKNIEDISCSVQQNLYYAPYIMSLIIVKTHFSAQNCDVKHKGYGPFRASPQLLNPPEQEGNPDAEGNNDANGPPNDAADPPSSLHLLLSFLILHGSNGDLLRLISLIISCLTSNKLFNKVCKLVWPPSPPTMFSSFTSPL